MQLNKTDIQTNTNVQTNTDVQTDLEFKVGSYYKMIINKTRLSESYDIKTSFGNQADCEINSNEKVIYVIGQLVELPTTIPSIMMYSSIQPSRELIHKYSQMKYHSRTSINLTLADGKSYPFPIWCDKGWVYSDAVESIEEATFEDYNKSCLQFSKNKQFGAHKLF